MVCVMSPSTQISIERRASIETRSAERASLRVPVISMSALSNDKTGPASVTSTRSTTSPVRPRTVRRSIPPEGRLVYRIERAACRTLAEGLRRYGNLAAHEWMGLLVRHASQRARLTLVNLPAARKRPFGSATSLTSGEERAVPLRVTDEGLLLDLADCPPLTLLRIYWPLPE